jgi:hypothetical protein
VETNFAIIDSVILQQTERTPVMKEKLMHIEMHLFSSAQTKKLTKEESGREHASTTTRSTP